MLPKQIINSIFAYVLQVAKHVVTEITIHFTPAI